MMDPMHVSLAWKVYGIDEKEQKEALSPSYSTDMDTPDNPWKRKIRLEVYNSDLTGTTNYSIVKVIAPDEDAGISEFLGQLSDGIFENTEVGKVEPVNVEDIRINRQALEQGYGYKNKKRFYDTEHPDQVCYIAELSDTLYSRNDFLKLADNNEKIAERIFSYCDWQSPESALEELFTSQEIVECPNCKHLILLGDEEDAVCEHCGTAIHVNWPY